MLESNNMPAVYRCATCGLSQRYQTSEDPSRVPSTVAMSSTSMDSTVMLLGKSRQTVSLEQESCRSYPMLPNGQPTGRCGPLSPVSKEPRTLCCNGVVLNKHKRNRAVIPIRFARWRHLASPRRVELNCAAAPGAYSYGVLILAASLSRRCSYPRSCAPKSSPKR